MKMNKDFNKLVGLNIKNERQKRKLTQFFVSSEIGINRTSLVGIEKGETSASLETLYKLANLFNCDITVFLPKKAIVDFEEDKVKKQQQKYKKDILNKIAKLESKKQYYLSLIEGI